MAEEALENIVRINSLRLSMEIEKNTVTQDGNCE
jgi:hypothetical protein